MESYRPEKKSWSDTPPCTVGGRLNMTIICTAGRWGGWNWHQDSSSVTRDTSRRACPSQPLGLMIIPGQMFPFDNLAWRSCSGLRIRTVTTWGRGKHMGSYWLTWGTSKAGTGSVRDVWRAGEPSSWVAWSCYQAISRCCNTVPRGCQRRLNRNCSIWPPPDGKQGHGVIGDHMWSLDFHLTW